MSYVLFAATLTDSHTREIWRNEVRGVMVIGTGAQTIDSQHTGDPPEQPTGLPANYAGTLRECVGSTVEHYLQDLAGHEVNDLYQVVMGEVEPPLLETLLAYTHGNQTRAARLLGLSRSTLRKKMAHYEIRRHP